MSAPSPTASARPTPSVPAGVWASWAVLDAASGAVIAAGGERGTNTTESMVKLAIVADTLRRQPTRANYAEAEAMLRDSDNDAAERAYRAGGGDAMLRRVMAACELDQTATVPAWWSETRMTAADAARMGACITGGRVTNPAVTAWIVAQMRAVRGEGRFGLGAVRADLAIKNGWTLRDDGLWHVNCLAVGPGWVAAVLLRYDGSRPLAYGGALCTQITEAVVPAD